MKLGTRMNMKHPSVLSHLKLLLAAAPIHILRQFCAENSNANSQKSYFTPPDTLFFISTSKMSDEDRMFLILIHIFSNSVPKYMFEILLFSLSFHLESFSRSNFQFVVAFGNVSHQIHCPYKKECTTTSRHHKN